MHERDLLVRHDDKETLGSIFVGLELVVGRFDSSASREEQEQLGRRMWIIRRFRNVTLNGRLGIYNVGLKHCSYIDVSEFCQFLVTQ